MPVSKHALILALAAIAVLFAYHIPADAQKGRVPRPGAGRPGGGRIPGGGLPGNPQGKDGDWYNLGPIGGKAAMVTNPGSGATSGLDVQKIIEDSPAEEAGLLVGDVIIGAPDDFGRNAYFELGEAIEAAESERKAKNAVVDLVVLRSGREEKLEVTVPHYGKDAKDFPGGEMRDAIVEDALKWLSTQQMGDGSWDCHLSSENGRVVMTSIVGMAFLAGGHDAKSREYKSTLLRAGNFVAAHAGKDSDFGPRGGANWNQSNWGLGYAGMFLAELHNASPIKGGDEAIEKICTTILANMEATGGFAHGPGGPNALNYLELEIVSNFCVAALGGGLAHGVEIDGDRIEKALTYIEQCGGGRGGVGYSTRQGQVGMGDVGRTGGAIMAFGAVGRDDHRYYNKMVGFLKSNLRTIIDGHVSPTMHQLAAAAASYREGDKVWESYWEAQRQECTMLRMPNNTFTGRPTEESASLGSNNDLELGPVWNTAHWTIILCLDKDNLPVWFGKEGKPAKRDRDDNEEEEKEEEPKSPVTGDKKDDKDEGDDDEDKPKKKKKKNMDDILD